MGEDRQGCPRTCRLDEARIRHVESAQQWKMTMDSASLPLEGLRVLDLSRVLAGPLASQMLGDLGAEVIKIERPGAGDDSRQYGGRPFIDIGDGEEKGLSSFFASANRNKKSVTIDISRPAGQALVLALASKSDVLIENYRVGGLARFGLDYESVRRVRPDIIYCSITGYGQTGPYRDQPGYDGIFQAQCGMMSVTGYPDDHPKGEARRAGPGIVDVSGSLYAGIAIIGALYGRDASGQKGRHIDLGLLDCGVALMSHAAQTYLASGHPPPRRGNAGPGGVPSDAFRCKDSSIMIVVGNNEQFVRLCDVLGLPDLSHHPDYCTTELRIKNRKFLDAIIASVFVTKPAAEWLERLVAAEVPAGLINDLAMTFKDPQVIHRQMERRVTSPKGVSFCVVGSPIRYVGAGTPHYEPPPTLGQHTDEVLTGLLGIGLEQLAELKSSGIL